MSDSSAPACVATAHAWQRYMHHYECALFKKVRLDALTYRNENIYLPSIFATIDDEFVEKHKQRAMPLLGKSVYVLRGRTSTTPIFGGLILVDGIEEGSGPTACFHLHGLLMSESGAVFEDMRVRVTILKHSFILYRDHQQ